MFVPRPENTVKNKIEKKNTFNFRHLKNWMSCKYFKIGRDESLVFISVPSWLHLMGWKNCMWPLESWMSKGGGALAPSSLPPISGLSSEAPFSPLFPILPRGLATGGCLMDPVVGVGWCPCTFCPEGAFLVTGSQNVLGHVTTDADKICVPHRPDVTLRLQFPRGKHHYCCDFPVL